MKIKEVEKRLKEIDQKYQKAVYTSHDLRILFQDPTEAAFSRTIKSSIQAGLLHRVTNGIFVFTKTSVSPFKVGTALVEAFRPSCINYLSLEYALSMWNVISQTPFQVTLMTTGRSGTMRSSIYGCFDFVHTARDVAKDIKDKNIIVYHDRLKLAKPHIAYRDLKRVGRNTHLVDMEAYEEALEEAAAMSL